MIGYMFLVLFFICLPWAWINVLSISVNVRPSLAVAILATLYCILFRKIKLNRRDINILISIFIYCGLLFLPAFLYDYPHWSVFKVLSQLVYLVLAFYMAKLYYVVWISMGEKWGMAWQLLVISTIVSLVVAFNTAFGSIVINPNVKNSSEFIFGNLYSGVFNEGGKSVRHTMATVPVIVIVFSLLNFKYSPKLSAVAIVVLSYFAIYPFSRSAWLMLALILVLVGRIYLVLSAKNILRLLLFLTLVSLVLLLLVLFFPSTVSFFGSLFADRMSDSQSGEGRFLAVWLVLTQTSLEEFLLGYDRGVQPSPHNFVLDALMQAGVLGMMGAFVAFYLLVKFSCKAFLSGDSKDLVIAMLAIPAIVRSFTAGGGLHIGELFGVFVLYVLSTAMRKNVRTDNRTESGSKLLYEHVK